MGDKPTVLLCKEQKTNFIIIRIFRENKMVANLTSSILLSIILLAAFSKAKSVHHQLAKRQTAVPNFTLGSAMRQFHENLYNVLGENENGNLVYSPYSIHTAMTMVLIGTPGNSTTYTELAKALGITESTVIGLNYRNLYD